MPWRVEPGGKMSRSSMCILGGILTRPQANDSAFVFTELVPGAALLGKYGLKSWVSRRELLVGL